MTEVRRTSVEEARRKAKAGDALLVCGYADEEKFKKLKIEGAIPLAVFESRLPSLSRQQEIIFYCA